MNEQLYLMIESRLRTLWTGSLDDIDFDNVEFSPRRDRPFLRLQVEPVGNLPISVGGLDRLTGYILVSIMTPINVPVSNAMAAVDMIDSIYGRWREGQLVTGPAITQRIGEREGYFQMNVKIDYQFDVCKH